MAGGSLTERVLRRDRLLLLALLGTLFVLACLYTIYGVGMRMTALEMTAMHGMRDMPGQGMQAGWSLSYALLVFLMWWVMMAAMMVPSVAPTVLLNAALMRHSGKADRVQATSVAFLGGYLVVWAGFSVVAMVFQWGLEEAGLVSPTMMVLSDTTLGGLVLIAAGLFQFTPMKDACIEHCRSPVKFLTERRRPGARGAIAMGVEHGAFCLGCCWFLMALLFVGGIMNLYWIVGLAIFVAVEKLTPWGKSLSKIAGAGLIAWGALTVAGTIWGGH